MDSGNSGSMQSSSGGDEDYDSRAESISAFLNNPPTTHHHHHHVGFGVASSSSSSQPQMFDPLSNYFDPIQRSPLNLDMVWSKPNPGRSELNPADLGAFINNPAFLLAGAQSRGAAAFPNPTTTQQSLPLEASSSSPRGLDQIQVQAQTNSNSNSNVVRNPKKRSRASRRAPTTVLTTDTTNFRAMVQEFTGIPAPPFTSSSSFPRSRLDFFGNSSASPLRSASVNLDPPNLPPYLLRPFPHKLHLPPPLTTSSSMPSSFPTNSSSTSSINYHLSSDLGPILNFQSILRPPQNSSSVILAPKSHHHETSLEIPPSFDSINHAPRVVNPSLSGVLHHNNMVSSSSSPSHGAMTNVVVNDGDRGGGVVTTTTTSMTNGIVNYLASSDFHGEKGPPVPRSEGMVESWINCSSD